MNKSMSLNNYIKQLSLVVIYCLSISYINAQQRNCGTMDYLNFLQSQDSKLKVNMEKKELQL